MPKADGSSERTSPAPYPHAPLLLVSGERKIVVPRLADYNAMLALAKRKIPAIRNSNIDGLVCKSASVPGLEGEKVEISEEVWAELIPRLRSFEVVGNTGDTAFTFGRVEQSGAAGTSHATPPKPSGSRPQAPLPTRNAAHLYPSTGPATPPVDKNMATNAASVDNVGDSQVHITTKNARSPVLRPSTGSAMLPFDKMVAIHAGAVRVGNSPVHAQSDKRFDPSIRPRTLPSNHDVTVNIVVFGYLPGSPGSWEEAFQAEINGRMTLGDLKAKLALVGTSKTSVKGTVKTYNEVFKNSFVMPMTVAFNDSMGNLAWKNSPHDDGCALASFLYLPESPPSYYFLRIRCLSTHEG
ncbi:unnamed protein product [Peniophora sp. CBMAI 1063]|nr:unnamed protein product [Peniophora sp. CBMAI 1063]